MNEHGLNLHRDGPGGLIIRVAGLTVVHRGHPGLGRLGSRDDESVRREN